MTARPDREAILSVAREACRLGGEKLTALFGSALEKNIPPTIDGARTARPELQYHAAPPRTTAAAPKIARFFVVIGMLSLFD